MSKVIREDQVHRILEDLQKIGFCLNSFKNKSTLLKSLAKSNHLPILSNLADGYNTDVCLLKEGLDALARDLRGMLDGNDKCKKVRK